MFREGESGRDECSMPGHLYDVGGVCDRERVGEKGRDERLMQHACKMNAYEGRGRGRE
jgi:hypothetical protein